MTDTTTPPEGTVLPTDQPINPNPNPPPEPPNPSPEPPDDCPHLVEQLAEYADDIDALAQCAVILVAQVPRTNSAASEHAFRRVGRIVERIAQTATTAALQAHLAVDTVRHGRPFAAQAQSAPPRTAEQG